ncbi:hypothetical protein BABINDRAFT_161744 [Babjeviella inositovora NRRL Y-12698]|uniref:Aldehyde dehydrogenase domain-containing protein n=1 Tax=Babjeviella inositovora NRRL Y-12698 TaxID=984486 RepID=A0A1E3QNP8_9ASCO|nr:uncharacterized protein BABINDRAFT_161744 [Babjeviella inositovora NRRL Y-12698]ODQ79336.1 hypothetical protein BABINDRAFT_161744 [Babjeviella inositovora NRRL Y-12698]
MHRVRHFSTGMTGLSKNLFVDIKLPTGKSIQQPIGLYINGEWVTSEKMIETICPYTETPITSVYAATEKEVDQAVKAARNAFKAWKKVPGEERAKMLFKLARLTEEHVDELASIEAIDTGKPKDFNAKADVDGTAALMEHCGGWADKIVGSAIPVSHNKFAYTIKEPLGVVGLIVPWNYPLSMAAWKIAPALAAGNCIVIKSAENTPLSLLKYATLIEKAGFPPGVVNIVSGYGAECGNAISSHPNIDKVSFTGSTGVGQVVQQAASNNLKVVTLECGGKSPLIVFEDADLEQAAKWASFGVMYNSGQNCTANSRLYVHEKVYDEFILIYKATILADYPMGDPFDADSRLGPVISKIQFDKVSAYIEKGKQEGATLVLGNESVPSPGYWIAPTVFADCNESMTVVKEEIFGPVVTISKFLSQEEVLEKANNSDYGLAAMVFTKDIARAHQCASELEAGSVYINSSNDEDIRVPFGGYKMSGVGRELGQEGIDIYTQTKSIHVNLGVKM